MKKLLSLLLCAAMLFGLLPLDAQAASDAWDGTVDISWYDPAKTEYEIDTPAKLAGLAALVNGMADPTAKKIVGNTAYLVSKKVDNVMLLGAGGGNVFDTVYTGGIDFAYKEQGNDPRLLQHRQRLDDVYLPRGRHSRLE